MKRKDCFFLNFYEIMNLLGVIRKDRFFMASVRTVRKMEQSFFHNILSWDREVDR